MSEALFALRRATFEFRTREDAVPIAQLAATLTRRPEFTELGIMELMINAVEHGNLGITNDLKARLVAEGMFDAELARRHTTPPYRDRVARMDIEVMTEAIDITITDDGDGFDWAAYTPSCAGCHGRGIELARNISTHLRFNARGNAVTARFRL